MRPSTRTTSTRRTTRAVGAVVGSLVLGITLAGCGSGVDDPEDAYAAAVKKVRDADTGRFLYALDAAGTEMMKSTGTYSVSTSTQDVTSLLTDGDIAQTSRRIDVGTSSFVNSDVEAGPCWLTDDAAAEPSQMAALRVLLEGKATAWETEGEVLTGTTPLPPLVTLLGELGAGIDLDPDTKERVPFTVLLDGDKVTAVKTDMGAVLRAAQKSGAQVPELLNPFMNEAVEISMLVGYSEPGSEVSISAPTTDLVERTDDTKATKAAYAACTAKAAAAAEKSG